MDSWLNVLRALKQLRSASLLRALVELRAEADAWERVRSAYPEARIERGVILKGWQNDRLRIGPGATVCKGTVLTMHESASRAGSIELGEGTWVGQYNNLRTCSRSRISIGKHVLISQFCSLVGSNHGIAPGMRIREQPADERSLDIIIGNDVWLGAGVTVLPGSRIGDGSVIGANSVVRGIVPPGEIWAGSPAVFRRTRGAE